MKRLKWISTFVIAISLFALPTAGKAESIEERISNQNQKIADLQEKGSEAQKQLKDIQKEVAQIEKDIQDVLSKKTEEEKQLNELNTKIADLEKTIEKREKKIQEQARDVQTTKTAGSFLDVVLSSSSLNEAVSKTMALNALVNANQNIMQVQIKDKEKLEKLQTEAEERLEAIQTKTEELDKKQDQLATAVLDQEVKINELSAQLSTEKSQKEAYEAQKTEAEQRRLEELAAMEVKKLEIEQALQEAQESEAALSNGDSSAVQEILEVKANPSGWASPLSYLSVTSWFGYRQNPFGSGIEFHNGIDFAGYSGMPVRASKAGTVVLAEYNATAGNVVILQHDDGYYSYYMHLSSFATSKGATVSAGQHLGGMGTTGSSTGVHLHFGVSTGFWSGYENPGPLLGFSS